MLITFVLCIGQCSTNAQTTDSIRINALEQKNIVLQEQLTKLEQRNQELAVQLESSSQKVNLLAETLEQQVGGLHEQMDSIDEHYGMRMESTETAVLATGAKQHRSVVWGIVVAALLCLLLIAAYFILRKLISKKGDDIELLRARADDLNRQMVEKMDKEIEELQKISEGLSTSTTNEPDHSLVIPIADAIARIENNIYVMDSRTRGLPQIVRAINKMRENLEKNGYEVVRMLGEKYNDKMVLKGVIFQPNAELPEGESIITTVNKPQINYHGSPIQYADIIVSQNKINTY